ncbi:gephyrin-like molybdotransferase Glp [Pelagibacterium montanilacus]|uniref:molybdopterin molybdotransferase MoeA n=1 Tax=Pelagibacterium montanilacus TaxID=2185280 RepID=UPI000F8DF99C|nr:gephyrin-like molybdotransferase Glp [Pelagibacterium montanilacus]
MISLEEALARIAALVSPLGTETLPVGQAAGRTLAETITAVTDNPPFRSSAMDGYAVRSEDVADGARLVRVGQSQAGARYRGAIAAGQCVRIFTGAPVPDDADAVVMQEKTTQDGGAVIFSQPVAPGNNIRPRANDFASGDGLASAGDILTPARLALVAAGNRAEVSVGRLPSLCLMATGDELAAPGSALGPDQIVGSNSIGLAALLAAHCRDVTDHGVAPDDRAVLSARIGAILETAPDVVVTTGGASVGEHDFVQDVLAENGVELDFWRIAMRPGKPVMVGRKGTTLVFGLPGNPVSALVTAQVLVIPALVAMAGGRPSVPMRLPLAQALAPNGPRRHFIRARIVHDGPGCSRVAPTGETDSGHLSSLALSDALIVQPENCPGRQQDDVVDVMLLYPAR